MSTPRKHHYAPAFLLKHWRGPTGRLIEWSKPHLKLLTKTVGETATGFEKDLYSFPKGEVENVQQIETDYLSPIDQRASLVLDKLLDGHDELSREQRFHWVQFLLTLTLRSPEDLQDLKRFVAHDWRSALNEDNAYTKTLDMPAEEIADWLDGMSASQKEALGLRMFRRWTSQKEVIRTIVDMHWAVFSLPFGSAALVTSDRPLIMTNGLRRRESHLAIPLSPQKLLICARERPMLQHLLREGKLAKRTNTIIVERACRYVWSMDRQQERFISKRIFKRPSPSMVSMLRTNIRQKLPLPPHLLA